MWASVIPSQRSTIHSLYANIHHLFFYHLQAKNDFYISQWLKENQKKNIHGMKITWNSISAANEVLLEHSHTFVYALSGAAFML